MKATIQRHTLVLAFALGVASCGPETAENAASFSPFLVPNTPEALRELAKDTTFHYSFGAAGVQLEHYTMSGDAYLWLPDTQKAVTGKWRIEDRELLRGTRICFKYDDAARFSDRELPVGEWSCFPQADVQRHVFAILRGDPFDLVSGNVPFVLPKNERWIPGRIAAATPRKENIRYVYLYDG